MANSTLKQAVKVALGTADVLHFDIETFSECDLKSAGVYRYAEHPSTEVLCLSFAFNEELVWCWVPHDITPEMLEEFERRSGHRRLISGPLPKRIVDHIVSGGEIRCHNLQFERTVLNGVAGKKIGFPEISIDQGVCTAAKMAASGLPRALGEAAKALGASPKDDQGRIVMLQVSKPRRGKESRYTPHNSPDKFITLYIYCIGDVEAERDIDGMVPDLSASELKTYHFDQLINSRGIKVDVESIHNILAVIDEYKRHLAAQMEEATRTWLGEGLKPTQRDKIATWVRENGYPQLEDMQAETVKGIIADPDVPDKVKYVLKIYSTYNMKAVTKYQAMLDAICDDNKLRGMFLYFGAGTGRWSSLIVQLQNLFRPVIDDPETAVEAFRHRDLNWIRTLYDGIDPMKVAASCIRSMLIASEGCDLLFPDFAGIESRVNAWLFDEYWKLGAYQLYDKGEGPDLYKITYARAFGIPVEDVQKHQRQLGKVMELALGYEGGVGAFVTMVDTYGLKLEELAEIVYPTLPEDVLESAEWMWDNRGKDTGLDKKVYMACDGLKQLWRQSNPNIRQGWRDLKSAAEQAVQTPGKAFFIPNRKIGFKVVEFKGKSWLKMLLPSGRCLSYFSPRWIPERTKIEVNEHGVEFTRIVPGELRYMGIDTHTRQWKEVSSYGGRWDENADQGLSRDKLVGAMFRLEAGGYPVIGSVHDEAITEPKQGYGSFKHAGDLMCETEEWAVGLPIAVDGHRGQRYRK